jgi:phospholipase C
MTRRCALLACAFTALLSGCGGQASTTPTSSPPAAVGKPSPCGHRSPGRAFYSHVIWLWMENQSYQEILGSSSAPYLNSLADACGLATNYHNITHPSLPNYIAATSGLGGSDLGPFKADCDPSASCSTAARSIFAQVPSWRAYEESMPAACDRHDSDDYAARHNPPPYYTSLVGCSQRDLPLTDLGSDLKAGSLPAFSFITPNLCHDTHDCPVSAGDRWLATEVPQIVDSRAYRAGQTVLFITWDEGEGGSTSDCATNVSDVGCHVATLIVSPSTPSHQRSGELFNHYSLLRTTEDLLGVPPLGEAANARSMARAFGLGS